MRFDLRVYRPVDGPVAPFLHLGTGVTGSTGTGTGHSIRISGRVGAGAEWFPLEGVSVSGSTGVDLGFGHHERGDDTADEFGVSFFRSALTLQMWF